MKVQAAAARKAGKPLSLETVDVEGPLAGEALPFDRLNEGFELMRRGEGIRSVVTY